MGMLKSFKSSVYVLSKRFGLLPTFLKANFILKRMLGVKPVNFTPLSAFYQEIVKPGNLVFDIGTNLGSRTAIFLNLKAKIVCVEPNTFLIDILRFRFKRFKDVTILHAGCGDREEYRTFQVSSNHLLSTFSSKFVDHKQHENVQNTWSKKDQIKIVTLDALVSKYGVPDFCKVDVEGYEREVFSGLNQKIKVISFEFNSPSFNDDSIWCINKLVGLGYSHFNLSFGESLKFEFSSMKDATALIDFIKNDKRLLAGCYGDIYAYY